MQSSRDSNPQQDAPPETDTTTTTTSRGFSATDAGKKLGRGRRVHEYDARPAKELHCTALHCTSHCRQDFTLIAGIADRSNFTTELDSMVFSQWIPSKSCLDPFWLSQRRCGATLQGETCIVVSHAVKYAHVTSVYMRRQTSIRSDKRNRTQQ